MNANDTPTTNFMSFLSGSASNNPEKLVDQALAAFEQAAVKLDAAKAIIVEQQAVTATKIEELERKQDACNSQLSRLARVQAKLQEFLA